jgi:hypothetical protein
MIMSEVMQKHGDSPDVEMRLAMLERSSKAWRLAALGLVGAWVLSLSCSRSDSGGSPVAGATEGSSGVTRTLRVNEIELVNLKGATVGWINKGGEPSISLSSPDAYQEKAVGPGAFDATVLAPGMVLTKNRLGFESHLCPDMVSTRDSNGECYLSATGWGLVSYKSVAGRKYNELVSQPVDANSRPALGERQSKLSDAREAATAVSIATGEGGGGMIAVRNTFGKPAVEIQANKTNQGAVYVMDVSGETRNALTPQ